VEGLPGLRDLYTYTPDRDGLVQAMQARRFAPAMRVELCAALRRGYQGCELHPAVQANLDALAQGNTLTVTTGHQLCLFTGPLYVPFKILNVVRLARELSTPDRNVVPVFWMATEDHDRAEIDHAWVGGQRMHWPGAVGGAVGRLPLTGISAVLDRLEPLLGPGAHAAELKQLLRSAYTEEHTLAQATRLFVNALFGRFGVVIVDGDDPSLKEAFAPVMREELLNEVTVRTVRYAEEKLGDRYPAQAHARDINLFYLHPGHRSRIEGDADLYRVLDAGPSFTLDALLAELAQHPERFSPNVLMRPLYQETILPNIGYVGGGGELAYWLQLRWLFQAFQLPMPALILRSSAAFLTAKEAQRWAGLGLGIGDLFGQRAELEARIARNKASFSTDISRERAAHADYFNALAERVRAIDPTLEASVRAKETFSRKGVDMIGAKLLRAAKRQQADALRQASDVLGAFFPDGLQERRDNFLPFYAAEGPAFFDRLLKSLDPLQAKFTVFEEG
jgi:bacillithiol synthase